MDKLSNEWGTPKDLFDKLNQEFNFDIDLCATRYNSKCHYYCIDYLTNSYTSRVFGTKNVTPGLLIFNIEAIKDNVTCFMNPPYSNPKPFIEKAWEDSRYAKIVCLVKCDPSTKWWATFWNYKYYRQFDDGRVSPNDENIGAKAGCSVRFFPKRIKFVPPKGYTGKASSPSFASALLIFDRRGLE